MKNIQYHDTYIKEGKIWDDRIEVVDKRVYVQ